MPGPEHFREHFREPSTDPKPNVWYVIRKVGGNDRSQCLNPWVVMEFVNGHNSATWQFGTGQVAIGFVITAMDQGTPAVRRVYDAWMHRNGLRVEVTLDDIMTSWKKVTGKALVR